jgi:hypothetical protein
MLLEQLGPIGPIWEADVVLGVQVKIRQRHDGIAHQRQKRLAQLLCLFNVVLAVGCGAIMVHYHWDPAPTQAEVIVLICLVALSWLFLFVAAGVIGWLVDLPTALGPGPPKPSPAVDDAFLSKHRMSFYYAGVILNLLAIAMITEITGGLAESPFTALLIAFVLTAEQLSRFKLQAKVMLCIGAAIVGVMIGLEGVASDPPSLAPHLLYIAVAVAALLGGGLLTAREKPRNHYVDKLDDPSRVLVYCDAYGNWRFAIYDNSHRQDPILLAGTGAHPVGFPDKLETQVIKCASDTASPLGWRKGKVPGWPSAFTTCFSLELQTKLDK